jgi:hypothetical protein
MKEHVFYNCVNINFISYLYKLRNALDNAFLNSNFYIFETNFSKSSKDLV